MRIYDYGVKNKPHAEPLRKKETAGINLLEVMENEDMKINTWIRSVAVTLMLFSASLAGSASEVTNATPDGIDARMGIPFSISAKSREKVKSPLFSAIIDGDTIKAVELIAKGADVNEKLEGSVTPLMIAASVGQTSVVQRLLLKGADVTAINRQGRTALMFAALQGRAPVVEMLVRGGSSVLTRDAKGCTPLILGVMSRDLKVVTVLADAKSEINAQDETGMTALIWSASSGLDEIATFLLSKQADPSIKNKRGLTAQDYARIANNSRLQELLKKAQESAQTQGVR